MDFAWAVSQNLRTRGHQTFHERVIWDLNIVLSKFQGDWSMGSWKVSDLKIVTIRNEKLIFSIKVEIGPKSLIYPISNPYNLTENHINTQPPTKCPNDDI